MSVQQYEESIDDGSPIYLYEARYGKAPGAVFRYNSSVDDQVVNGAVWEAATIRHGEIAMSGNLDRSTLNLIAVEDISAADLFIATSPSEPVVLTIFRGHIDVEGLPREDSFFQVWVGRVLSSQWNPEEGTIELGCEPSGTSIRRLTLRRYYQYGCTHVLYGPMCKLSPTLHTGAGVVMQLEAGRDFLVRITAVPHGMDDGTNLNGGKFRALLPDGRQVIRSLSSTKLVSGDIYRMRLLSSFPENFVGLAFEVQRGCQHNWDACKSFDNLPNFGGCPNIPVKNPFTTSLE
jgi:hypothetical protein